MRYATVLVCLVVVTISGAAGAAVLSDNLLVNGGFESTDNLKNSPTLDDNGV